MNLRLPRPLALGVVTLVTAGGVALGAAPANAAVVGSLTVTPANGFDDSSISVSTSGPCPSGTNVVVTIKGSGFPAAGFNVVGNTPISTFPTNANGGYDIPLTDTLRNYAAAQTPPATFSGDYVLTVVCRTALSGTSLGDFTGTIRFTTPTTYQFVTQPTNQDTTTALGVSPAGPVTQGSPVTLTATVAPAAATGTVQFFDGTTAIGSPVPVSGGTATLAISTLAVGTHSLTAQFTGGTGFNNSTSAAVSLVVQQAPPTAVDTTTSLSVSPGGTVDQGTPVTLTGTVTPSNAVGTVRFFDGSSPIAPAITVSGGTATLTTSSLTPGTYNLTARFTPTDPTAFNPSTSTNITLTVNTVTPPGSSTDTQVIRTTVSAGALTITSDDTPVVLPEPVFNPTTSILSTSGAINEVTVTDTRAGNPGWNVSGQVTDFANSSGDKIDGRNLGWTPKVISKLASQTVNAGAAVAPAPGVEPGGTADPSQGLKTARVLATAPANGGRGTAVVSADLALNAPTSTKAGTYNATLTLTAI